MIDAHTFWDVKDRRTHLALEQDPSCENFCWRVELCKVLIIKSRHQVAKPENGKDVNLTLVVRSKNTVDMPLSIAVGVQAMRHNGTPSANIKNEVKEATLQPSEGNHGRKNGKEPTIEQSL